MEVKPIHTILLDAGPILRGEPSVSTLMQKCERLVTLPSVISEIRDQAARTRLQTILLPFLHLQSPQAESVRIVTEFSRKTGDLAVLSRTDLQILALAYELECERNGGNWRLRSAPGQKRTNGPPPRPEASAKQATDDSTVAPNSEPEASEEHPASATGQDGEEIDALSSDLPGHEESQLPDPPPSLDPPSVALEVLEEGDNGTELVDIAGQDQVQPVTADLESLQITDDAEDQQSGDDSDSEGWITPSNIKKRQEEDEAAERRADSASEQPIMQVATITSDFAMQNVLMQMNLNLLSPALQRVRHVKTFVLRCHACFQLVKDPTKQFCPRCGKPALTRVACSTNQNGEFKLHLKSNMTWNKRGDKFSIPKPVHGSSHGRVQGGGQDSWGANLILAEDQKEYTRAVTEQRRQKHRDLMDEDYMPSILSGDRNRANGKPKVGAGRSVNSRKKK